MSIRTNKMKAVAVLMKQLTTARRKFHERGRDESFDGKLEKLRLDLNKIKDVFVRVKKKEEELLDTLAEVYDHLRKLDCRKLDQDMNGICQRIRDSAHNLLPTLVFDDSSKEEDDKIFHSSKDLVQPHQDICTKEDYDQLSLPSRNCLLSLFIFPENAVIKKRNAINLWIGEGLITNNKKKTAEEMGEDVIDDLLKFNVIVRYGNWKSPVVNKFQILPGVRDLIEGHVSKQYVEHHGTYFSISLLRLLRMEGLELDQKRVTLGGRYYIDRTIPTVFNIGSNYLNFRPQWVSELKNLVVFQLGRWQDSALHHIEVGSQEFLKELRYLKKLKYVSLRGISRIFELPSSITELENLLILDVKACHNLERLPDDISSMKSLTHLIMSECWLLEGMPKGIENLSNLEVLKGFLISTPEKTPCRISDLVNLRKLRRLSIHIGSEAEMRDGEFENLKDFLALKHLKISWSVSDPKCANIHGLLPYGLRKLHLECFPGKSFKECFMLKHSYAHYFTLLDIKITGGKLESMKEDLEWRMGSLRLKYLKQLNVDIDDLKAYFPDLRYVEVKQVSNISYLQHQWAD
ncbi:disease resistance RPP13-like protein 4 [Vigna unguiculata]|uniref:disease resistance RPP13-like protein 4 n=1 Tax=Vigna unguiculata TaxID=3917 RepID=UPI0010160A55|nr:disease resistance RPP13-like protein 4 [Vigna unguiculata]XP_027927913.1 disease resistance RPP13-like protein 4 [Vigna unguiculata]XP_027927914.1 disease resistance RPP13-like protein 4 [Vigna unguiculata]